MATGYFLVASPMIAVPKTAGYFLKDPLPNEVCFTTKEGDFLTASDRQKIGELSKMVFSQQVKRTSAKYPRDVEHLHLSWGYKGKDFDITRDGRAHVTVRHYEITNESLFYRVVWKMGFFGSALDSIYYVSEPNKEVYVKASELLKAAN